MTAPKLPVRLVHFRWIAQRRQFVATTDADDRATLIVRVDADGWPVAAVHGANGNIIGWKRTGAAGLDTEDTARFLRRRLPRNRRRR